MVGLRVMEVNFNNIIKIYEKEVRVNTKNKRKVYRFDRYKMEYLIEIYDRLNNLGYGDLKYNIFLIRYPKYRVVMSLDIVDKVINHYVTRYMLMPKLERYLDIRNVATREGMGRDYGIRLVKKYLEYYKSRGGGYVLKLDISKYFYSINHDVLKSMLYEYLDSDEYVLIQVIIDSTNKDYINKKIIDLKERELLRGGNRCNEIREIPLYEKGKGLPIGNMSSQFLSIFYLNRLDHKIVHDYRLKHYVRYMDDFVIFSLDKEYLKRVKGLIEEELECKYKLSLNKKKTKIVSIYEGFNFCGYRFRVIGKKTVINVCRGTLKRVKKRVKEVKYLYNKGLISFGSTFSSINTYYNGFKYGSRKKVKRIVDKYFFG